MTANQKAAQDALRRLADALAEDILDAPDNEILNDAEEVYGDTNELAARMLNLFEAVASEQGKAKLHAARAAIDDIRKETGRRLRIDRAAALALLQQAFAAHPEAARKLTFAMRKGVARSINDEDVLSMLEDLEALGQIKLPRSKDDEE